MPISLSDDDDIWAWIFKSNRSAQIVVRGEKPLSPLPSSKARECLTPAEPSDPREASAQADEGIGVYDSDDVEHELTVNETETESVGISCVRRIPSHFLFLQGCQDKKTQFWTGLFCPL